MSSLYRKAATGAIALRLSTLLLASVCALDGAPRQEGAPRKYVIGSRIDFLAGGRNMPAGSGLVPAKEFSPFYATYPSIQMTSTGEHSVLQTSYAFGYDRIDSSLPWTSRSHAATSTLSVRPGAKWKVNLSESFNVTSDLATFNGIRGVTTFDQGFSFPFYPVTSQSSVKTNYASFGTDYTFNDKAAMSVSFSHDLRYYGDAAVAGRLSDQQRASGNVRYSRRINQRNTWSLGYTGIYLHFRDFENAVSHAATIGYSRQFTPYLTLSMNAGPSRVEYLKSRDHSVSYNADVRLEERFKKTSFSIYFAQYGGDTSGLGSISDTRRAGLNVGVESRHATLFLDVSVFDSKGKLDNVYNTRGAMASASVGLPLNRTFSVNAGGQYQRYDHTVDFGFEQKRLFISLRMNAPALWRFAR